MSRIDIPVLGPIGVAVTGISNLRSGNGYYRKQKPVHRKHERRSIFAVGRALVGR